MSKSVSIHSLNGSRKLQITKPIDPDSARPTLGSVSDSSQGSEINTDQDSIIINPNICVRERRELVDSTDFVENADCQQHSLRELTRQDRQAPSSRISSLYTSYHRRDAGHYRQLIILKTNSQFSHTSTLIDDLFIPPAFGRINLHR